MIRIFSLILALLITSDVNLPKIYKYVETEVIQKIDTMSKLKYEDGILVYSSYADDLPGIDEILKNTKTIKIMVNEVKSADKLKYMANSECVILDYNADIYGENSFKLNINFLLNFKKLKELDIHTGYFKDQERELTEILSKNNNLEALELYYFTLDYGLDFLSSLKNLKKLAIRHSDLGRIPDLKLMEKIGELTQLEELDLCANGFIRDISALKKLKNLRRLNISGTNVEDLSPLTEMSNLKSFDFRQKIADIKYTNINALANLSNLEELYICSSEIKAEYYELMDMLKNFKDLRVLYFQGDNFGHNNKLSDFSFLENMKNMEKLGMSNTYATTLSEIKNLTKLKKLELIDFLYSSENQEISGDFFEKMTELEYIDIRGHSLSSLSGMDNLVKLKHLSLEHISDTNYDFLKKLDKLEHLAIKYSDFSDTSLLKNLINIEKLVLTGDEVSDISGLSEMKKLKYLYLNNNKISDLSGLSGCHELEDLHLDDNNIRDLTPLSDKFKIETLSISGNKISTLDPISKLPKVRYLSIYGNNITNVEALYEYYFLDIFIWDEAKISEEQINELKKQAGGFEGPHLRV